MMTVDVNWLAVILAALSTMVVGSVWYSLKVFGTVWTRLAGVKPSGDAKDAIKPIAVTLVVSLITAYVLAHITFLAHAYFGNSWLQDAIMTAFWLWLGCTATRFVTHDAFEGRPWKLTLLNVSHELVTFLVMGLVIGMIH